MLGSMRTLSKSIVSKLLMLMLIVSFGAWGVGDILKSSGNPGYAAKVGSETITAGEFQQQRQLFTRQLESMGIKGLPAGQLEMTVIRQLITQKLSTLAMRDMNLFVNDETIGRSLAANPNFQDEHGKFSKVHFTYMLSKQGMKEQAFVAEYKRDLAGRFLTESLSMEDAVAPSSILTLAAIGANETRDVVLLTVSASEPAGDADEAALKTYYDAHKDTDYMRAETRNLEYVVLTQSEVDALVAKSVTDEAVTKAMTERKKTNKSEVRDALQKEQRESVMHDLSNSIEDELAAGKTMGEAFTKSGIHAEPRTLNNITAEFAKTSEDDITRTVAEQGFGLSEGEISRLITSKKGTLLMVSAKKINSAAPKPLEEVKADVKAHMAKELAAEAARAKAQSVKEALSKSPNWQAVANDKKVPARIVSRVGRPVEGKAPLDGIPPSLQQAIFQHPVHGVAGPVTLSNGDQLIAFITDTHLQTGEAASSAKQDKFLSKQLGQNVEAHAYQSFSEKHHVEINPAIMHTAASPEAE